MQFKNEEVYFCSRFQGIQSMVIWLQGRNMIEDRDRAKTLRSPQPGIRTEEQYREQNSRDYIQYSNSDLHDPPTHAQKCFTNLLHVS